MCTSDGKVRLLEYVSDEKCFKDKLLKSKMIHSLTNYMKHVMDSIPQAMPMSYSCSKQLQHAKCINL